MAISSAVGAVSPGHLLLAVSHEKVFFEESSVSEQYAAKADIETTSANPSHFNFHFDIRFLLRRYMRDTKGLGAKARILRRKLTR